MLSQHLIVQENSNGITVNFSIIIKLQFQRITRNGISCTS